MRRCLSLVIVFAIGAPHSTAIAQTSSLGERERLVRAAEPVAPPSRETAVNVRNVVYDQHSWISIAPPRPKTYRPGDLLTIIIRERREWKAGADLQTKKEWDVKSELDKFLKLTGGGVGAAAFRRGQPNIDFEWENKLRGQADSSRDDSLTTRLTAKIIDVKPNGLLVLEGRGKISHDEETSEITITGTCRKEDVTADNTILSTQVSDKDVVMKTNGALRATSSRGWIPKMLDAIKPF